MRLKTFHKTHQLDPFTIHGCRQAYARQLAIHPRLQRDLGRNQRAARSHDHLAKLLLDIVLGSFASRVHQRGHGTARSAEQGFDFSAGVHHPFQAFATGLQLLQGVVVTCPESVVNQSGTSQGANKQHQQQNHRMTAPYIHFHGFAPRPASAFQR